MRKQRQSQARSEEAGIAWRFFVCFESVGWLGFFFCFVLVWGFCCCCFVAVECFSFGFVDFFFFENAIRQAGSFASRVSAEIEKDLC